MFDSKSINQKLGENFGKDVQFMQSIEFYIFIARVIALTALKQHSTSQNHI